jgi:DNA polymerase-4
MTVRFETRASGPGQAHTLPHDSPDVTRANPVDSLDWPDYVDRLTASDEGAP